MLTKEIIIKIAKLAKLSLSEKEIAQFTAELNEILNYSEKLNAVNTDNVEPFSQITDLTNITKQDQIKESSLADQLLECSPNQISNRHITVKNVF